jgi:hypothetical protein
MVVNGRALKRLAGLLAVSAATGCSETPSAKTLTISGVTYTFPSEHVEAASSEDGRPYARMRAPGGAFYLEYSDDIERTNQQGADVPTIPSINSAPGPHNALIEVINTPAGKVVCDRAPRRNYDCGMRVFDSGVPWSVHFQERDLPRVGALKSAVDRMLASYRNSNAQARQ